MEHRMAISIWTKWKTMRAVTTSRFKDYLRVTTTATTCLFNKV